MFCCNWCSGGPKIYSHTLHKRPSPVHSAHVQLLRDGRIVFIICLITRLPTPLSYELLRRAACQHLTRCCAARKLTQCGVCRQMSSELPALPPSLAARDHCSSAHTKRCRPPERRRDSGQLTLHLGAELCQRWLVTAHWLLR